MWIVRLALRRTYTFVVMALLIAVVGGVSIYRMSTDIFPEINIPVVSVVWQYTGMPADEIETRVVLPNERVLTTAVNDIEHIESQSLFGVGVIRIYFQPGAKIEAAVAQVTATSQAMLKIMPPGINPPYIVQYSATSVPIVQIAVSSDTLTEQQIFDYAANFVIQRLGTVQGARVPQPFGGKWRQVMVDLDLDQLYARGLSPQDLRNAITNQNLIIPAGTAKIGPTEYYVKLNSSPDVLAAFNDIPIKTVNGVPVYVKNVAHVRDGYAIQTNIVRPRRPPGGTHDRSQGGRGEYPGRGPAGPRGPARHPGPAAPRAQDGAAVRPVDLRPGGGPGRAQGGGHRGRFDGPHDPALPRLVAEHADRRHLDPAVDPGVCHHPLGAGLYAQHHDPGRHGPGRGHPGG